MSRCDLCDKANPIHSIRTTPMVVVGEGEARDEYHQILICDRCIEKLYREYILAPKNQKLLIKKESKPNA